MSPITSQLVMLAVVTVPFATVAVVRRALIRRTAPCCPFCATTRGAR